jgi:cytochrome c biogenesis protein CcmG/thiol:disulfide interchange protein DsbE
MRRPPARRYVQVLAPLVLATLVMGGTWLTRPRTPSTAALPAGTTVPSSLRKAVVATGPLPPISGTTLDGSRFDPSTVVGKVVIVNVWNPDCGPCRTEAPALARAWRSLGPRGVAMIGLMYVGGSWPDDRAAASRFLARYGISYPIVVDSGAKVADALHVPGIPVTVVADATGTLRYRIVGEVQQGQLERLVDRIAR